MCSCRRYRWGSCAAVLLAATLGLWVLAAASASAHGVLEGSNPPANATLDAPPQDVVLKVTEPVDPRLSTVTVTDRSGRRLSGATVVTADGKRIDVPVTGVTRGIFVVKWRFLSRLDGHTSSGAFLFSVGQALVPGAGSGEGSPDRFFVVVRWISVLAAILLAGSTFFPVAVLQPSMRHVPAVHAGGMGATAARSLRALTVIAALVQLAALGIEALVQSTALLDAPLPQQFASGMVWVFLLGTKPGWSAIIRGGAALVLLLPAEPRGCLRSAALLRPEAYALGGLLLAGLTLTAHGAAAGAPGLFADVVHLLAVAVWMGGLASLLVVLATAAPPDRSVLARALVPRFSTVAGLSLAVVLLTGAYSTWVEVPTWRAFVTTAYGRVLLAKLALVAGILGFGAFHRFVLVPQLRTRMGAGRMPQVQRFLGSASGEVTLGATVLLAVAVITAIPPARATVAVTAREPVVFVRPTGDDRIRLTVTPAQAGWNRFEAVVADRAGRPMASESRILLRLTKLDETIDPVTVTLPHQGQGGYVAEGGQIAVPGWWQAEVVVRRRGRGDVSAIFPLLIGQPPRAPDPGGRRPLDQARAAMRALRAWRATELLNDGTGQFLLTEYELQQPDRLRFRTSEGMDVIQVGTVRYERLGSAPWKKEPFVRLLVSDGTVGYLTGAEDVAVGREGQCDSAPCRIVTWTTNDRAAAFAAWIDLRTHRMLRLLMAAPGHYMSLQLQDFDAVVDIEPPRP